MNKPCPNCNGEGYIEWMTRLTYDGHQSWTSEECKVCHGSCEVPVICTECRKNEVDLAGSEWCNECLRIGMTDDLEGTINMAFGDRYYALFSSYLWEEINNV